MLKMFPSIREHFEIHSGISFLKLKTMPEYPDLTVPLPIPT